MQSQSAAPDMNNHQHEEEEKEEPHITTEMLTQKCWKTTTDCRNLLCSTFLQVLKLSKFLSKTE